jgi:hypothetical protein
VFDFLSQMGFLVVYREKTDRIARPELAHGVLIGANDHSDAGISAYGLGSDTQDHREAPMIDLDRACQDRFGEHLLVAITPQGIPLQTDSHPIGLLGDLPSLFKKDI